MTAFDRSEYGSEKQLTGADIENIANVKLRIRSRLEGY